MGLYYIDEAGHGKSGYFMRHEISDLISGFLEPVVPSEAYDKAYRLAELLILSNHLDQAQTLLCALYKYANIILPPSDYPHITGSLIYFWHAHPDYTRPENSYPKSHQPEDPEAVKSSLADSHWNAYRECTRTGWMLEHCNLPEPDDPHVWKEADDEPMIAMCARLLAKDKTPGQYPPTDQLREALAAAKKLYARPQPPITEWKFKWQRTRTVRRHSYLLYRRLVVEIAIRVGELDTAAEVLSQGLRLDGFNSVDGGQSERFLFLPGIYDILPILAEKGKEGNPFFIEKSDAESMLQEIIPTLELRADYGRQWSLAPEKVGWKELLNRLAEGAWKVHGKAYRRDGMNSAADILHPPASEEQIKELEDKVGELPVDLKEMLLVADGFRGGYHFLDGGMAGSKNIRVETDDLVECRLDDLEDELEDDADVDGDSGDVWCVVMGPAAECDGFQHFFITPSVWRKIARGGQAKDGEYRYWNGAAWDVDWERYGTVRDWVARCVEEVERMVKRGETTRENQRVQE